MFWYNKSSHLEKYSDILAIEDTYTESNENT